MAGVIHDRAAPYRKLSAGGVLGFHAPYVTLPEGKYSKEQTEEIAQSMRKAILFLLKLSSQKTQMGSSDFLKKSLVQKILEKGPQDVLFVKTIGDAARWGINIYDADQYYKVDYDINGLKNVCNNFHYSNMDDDVPKDTNLSVRFEKYSSRFHADDFRVLVQDARTKDTVCELYPRNFKGSQSVAIFACSYDYWSSKSFGNCREYKTAALFSKYAPSFFALDPGTLLKRFKN